MFIFLKRFIYVIIRGVAQAEHYCVLHICIHGGGNSTPAEEVSRFQCSFSNLNWLVWKGIPPPNTRSNIPMGE